MTRGPDTLAERSRRAVWHPCTQMKRHEREPLLATGGARVLQGADDAHAGSPCTAAANTAPRSA